MSHLSRALCAGLVAGLLCLASGAVAQTAPAVGVVTTLTGQAEVARAALPAPRALRFKDDVFSRDRIRTGEDSLVRVLLGGKALVTARELSVVTIAEDVGRSWIGLEAGKVAVGVQRQKMAPGETVEVRTPNAIAAVRGTILVVEVSPPPGVADGDAGGLVTHVHVLKGLVDVFPRGLPGAPAVRVGKLETVTVTALTVGVPQPLAPAAVRRLTAEFDARQARRQTSAAPVKPVPGASHALAAGHGTMTPPPRLQKPVLGALVVPIAPIKPPLQTFDAVIQP